MWGKEKLTRWGKTTNQHHHSHVSTKELSLSFASSSTSLSFPRRSPRPLCGTKSAWPPDSLWKRMTTSSLLIKFSWVPEKVPQKVLFWVKRTPDGLWVGMQIRNENPRKSKKSCSICMSFAPPPTRFCESCLAPGAENEWTPAFLLYRFMCLLGEIPEYLKEFQKRFLLCKYDFFLNFLP